MDINEQVLSIIENYCGQSFRKKSFQEYIPLKQNMGILRYNPLSVDEMKVRSSEWAFSDVFGTSDWIKINPHDVLLSGDKIIVSGGILNSHYTEADVTYSIGYTQIPDDILKAHDILVNLIGNRKGDMSSYSLSVLITEEITEILAPYIFEGR